MTATAGFFTVVVFTVEGVTRATVPFLATPFSVDDFVDLATVTGFDEAVPPDFFSGVLVEAFATGFTDAVGFAFVADFVAVFVAAVSALVGAALVGAAVFAGTVLAAGGRGFAAVVVAAFLATAGFLVVVAAVVVDFFTLWAVAGTEIPHQRATARIVSGPVRIEFLRTR